MEVSDIFSSKDWARIIYLMRKSLKKEPNEKDTLLLYKAIICAEQIKKDEEFDKMLTDSDTD